MGEKIALGFHTCVDYELKWDTQIVEEQIKMFDIHADELKTDIEVDSERAVWIVMLAHLKEGIGGEMVPNSAEICEQFASHFQYEVTLGGTATRAAIVLDKIGYDTVLQTSCYNHYVERLMPPRVHVLSGVEPEHNTIYPHVVVQCCGGVRIHANDIDFVTPRENRLMVSRDVDSLDVPILPEEFGKLIKDAEVFLLGCFSEIIEKNILEKCLTKTKELLSYLPKDAVVVAEDGCYVKKDFRYYAHDKLSDCIDILSMNEDELQEYINEKIDILDAEKVNEAVEYVYKKSGIETIIIHSSKWALAYGKLANQMYRSLEGAITMAGTRFRMGDVFSLKDYEETKRISPKNENVEFCEKFMQIAKRNARCIPCKDLSHVKKPTVVGLGDSFAGGLLPGLLKKNRNNK